RGRLCIVTDLAGQDDAAGQGGDAAAPVAADVGVPVRSAVSVLPDDPAARVELEEKEQRLERRVPLLDGARHDIAAIRRQEERVRALASAAALPNIAVVGVRPLGATARVELHDYEDVSVSGGELR